MKDQSHITVILDRTGSMMEIRDDVIGGFNAFLAEQQAASTPATFTLVQFDSQDPYEVLHHDRPIAEVTPLTPEQYLPRASTPLYDAMGRGILDLESREVGGREEGGRMGFRLPQRRHGGLPRCGCCRHRLQLQAGLPEVVAGQ